MKKSTIVRKVRKNEIINVAETLNIPVTGTKPEIAGEIIETITAAIDARANERLLKNGYNPDDFDPTEIEIGEWTMEDGVISIAVDFIIEIDGVETIYEVWNLLASQGQISWQAMCSCGKQPAGHNGHCKDCQSVFLGRGYARM